MLGGLNPLKKEATIIGGGIAGMLAAYRLGQWGYEVELHEKGPWLGGLLGTTHHSYGMVEHAAHSTRASAPVQKLCSEIGVELIPLKSSKAAYIFRDGKFHRMPLYISEIATAFFRSFFIASRGRKKTLHEFGLRYLGKAATNYVLTPMAFGVYGARPSELQIPEAFPRFKVEGGRSLFSHLVERHFRRKGKSPMVAPKNGMGELVKKLEEALHTMPNVHIHTHSEQDILMPSARNRILAVPAYTASKLLVEEDPYTSGLLADVSYSPLISTTVFVERESLKHFPGGVGVLIPEVEDIPILGVLFNSSSFEGRVADNGIESLTVLCGGTPNPHLIHKTDDELKAHITEGLDRIFGLKKPPLVMHINRWEKAIPLYNAHLALAQQRAREGWGALLGNILVGNYTGQVSLRGMIEDSLHFEDNE